MQSDRISDLVLVDHVAARFGVLTFGEIVADGPDASADPVARVDDRDVGAESREIAGGREAGKPGTGHKHFGARKSLVHLNGS